MGRAGPMAKRLVAPGGVGDGLLKPGVEGFRGGGVAGAETLHIVPAHAAADDQHALVPQRAQRPAGGQMLLGIEVSLQRQLDNRKVGLGQGDLERDEHAVIIAALGVLPRWDAGALKQVTHALRQVRRAGRVEAELIGVRRKAGIVIDQRRLGRRPDRKHRLLPVTGDHQDRFRLDRHGRHQGLEPSRHPIPGMGRRPFHEEAGAPTVRNEQGRKPRMVCGGGHWASPNLAERSASNPPT